MARRAGSCLYKDDVFPIIRFNTHDVSAFRTDTSALGLNLARITGFLGRSDTRVKLRGINIYPTGVGAILTENHPELHSEYICEVIRLSPPDDKPAWRGGKL